MYIENVTLKSVPADSLILPVEEGTILTKNGTIPADLSQAYGIVPQKITNIPPTKRIYLAVAGTIDLKLNNVSFTEEEMQALGKDFNFVPGDEGGGNPNRVQTITGTLDTIATDINSKLTFEEYGEFLLGLNSGNTSAEISVDASALGFGTFTTPFIQLSDGYFGFITAYWEWGEDDATFESSVICVLKIVGIILGLSQVFMYDTQNGNVNMRQYASLLPYTLTIYWHPLPDQS